MDICDTTIAFTTKYNIPGRLRVKTTITHQVESPLSEKNIDPCFFLDKSEVNCIVWMNQNEWEQWSHNYICDMD